MKIQLELLAAPYLIAMIDSDDLDCLRQIGRCETELVSVTKTKEEISLVVEDSPRNRELFAGVSEIEPDWRAFRIVGPLAFNLVGILADLTRVLASAEIPVFCLSTFLTDYILVKASDVTSATEHLRNADYSVMITS